jgi:carbon-monoxide dehydrogenase small subunit
MSQLNCTINGQTVKRDVEPQVLLVDFLRDTLGMTGTHIGCDTSQCGCCTVLVDGASVKGCTTLAIQTHGKSVTTIEGMKAGDQLHPIQQAFAECHGLQCGFCTPGMIMTAACLLAETPNPTDDQIVHALDGNLCRCTGYVNIVAAVRQAAAVMRGDRPAAAASGTRP